MNLVIKYKPNKPQSEFQPDLDTKFLHFSAGYGSGKSFGLIQKLFKLSYKNRPHHGGLVCPSYADFKRDIMILIEEICDKNKIHFRYHKNEHWYQFPWTHGKVFVATGEKPLKGPNWAYACINELTLLKFERYREVIARVRLKKAPYPQIASCGTPEGLLTGYYDFFIENPSPNAKVIYGSTDENMDNLSSDYIKSLETAYDSRMLEAYRHGKFVNITGNRFYYAYDPQKNCDDTMVENPDFPVMASMDFNVDHMVTTIWQWQNDGSLGAVDQVALPHNADTEKMCDAMKARGYTPDRTELYPDPAANARSTKGRPDLVILRNRGYYNIKVRSQAPPFRRRQLNACNLLEKKRVKINKKKATLLHRDWLLCTQNVVTLEKDKSAPELTHASDGADYMFDIVFEFSGRKPESSIFQIR